MSPWIWLGIAIILEVAGTMCLKLSNGLSNLIFTGMTCVFYGFSFLTFAFALKGLELSIAYAIWASLGTTLIALIGIFIFHESASTLKILSIILIIAGVVGLNLSGGVHQ